MNSKPLDQNKSGQFFLAFKTNVLEINQSIILAKSCKIVVDCKKASRFAHTECRSVI